MKEEKRIIEFSLLILILLIIFYILDYYRNIIINLGCGLIVGLVTAFCQYFTDKQRIENEIYGLYFNLYRSCYSCKTAPVLFHYNVISVFIKLDNVSSKISATLGNYDSFFDKKKFILLVNPPITFGEGLKIKNIRKMLLLWFNHKEFSKLVDPLMTDLEKVLVGLNQKRFFDDKQRMVEMCNFIYGH